MIQSMTGYGKATAELSDKKINVEIKSLNSKAMDLSTRIAPLYREKEIEIRNEIAKALERGKVDFSLWIDKKDACELITPINQDVVVAYYERIRTISETTGIPAPEDWFSTLLRMPDVMTKNDIQELSEEEWKAVHATVLQAIQNLVDFRIQEGAALEKKFREKISNIAKLLTSVDPYEKERVEKRQTYLAVGSAHCHTKISLHLIPIQIFLQSIEQNSHFHRAAVLLTLFFRSLRNCIVLNKHGITVFIEKAAVIVRFCSRNHRISLIDSIHPRIK